MDAARWERMQALFHGAADLPPDQQATYLAQTCDDAALRAEVQALLAEDAAGSSLLDGELGGLAEALLDNPAMLPTMKFGPYQVTGILGEGGMGVVYRAERGDLGSVAAIKILRDAWLSPARRERFLSEQRTLARLNHPAIARLYDADTLADGTPWFVMEYVEGTTLTAWCADHASSLRERLRLFRQVCEAVQHAHRQAIIHRDLKPSNILVTADGTVKLLDFGIARHLDDVGDTDQTRTGLRMMTPAYAAPEQVRGESLGVYTDVYALGVTLFELLSGRLPFDLSRLTPGEASTRIVSEDPPRLATAARETVTGRTLLEATRSAEWADLEVLCHTAIQKDPARRYPTVDALVADIDHFLAGEPLVARPDSFGYRATKFLRRNWVPVTTAAAVTAAALGLIFFYTAKLRGARDEALAAASRAGRIETFMTHLFQGGDADAGPADSLRVTTLLARGVQETRSLVADPVAQADLYQTLGTIYQQLGQFDRADTLLRSALERRGTPSGPAGAETGMTLVALGLLRADQAKYDAADSLVRQGIALVQQRRPPGHPDRARAQAALGLVLEDRGKYEEAIAVLDTAVQLFARDDSLTTDRADAIEELANSHFYLGHYEVADSLNQLLLPLERRLHGDRHPAVADILINLGAIHFDRGEYPEAERYDREALAIERTWYGENHYQVASALTLLGRALVYQKRFDEGVPLLKEAVSIQVAVNGPNHPRVASAVNDLGAAALQQGDYAEAEADFRRMGDIYRSVYGSGHYLIALATANLASVYLARKEYPQAEQLLRQAVAGYAAAQGPTHINVGIARIKLGRSLLRQHRYREAEQETSAGYAIVAQQAEPSVSWLTAARKDLVEAYDALGRPDQAAKFRAALADTGHAAITAPKGN